MTLSLTCGTSSSGPGKRPYGLPVIIFGTLALPVLFLVLFTQIFTQFGNLPGFPAGGYVQFATAGIIVLNPLINAQYSGTAVVDDINSGFLSKMLVTPVNRPAILFGRLLNDTIMVLIPAGITLALAYALGVTVITGAPGILLILFTAAFFGLSMSGLTMAIGVTTKSAQVSRRVRSCDYIPSHVCEHSARAIRVPSGLGAGLFECQPV